MSLPASKSLTARVLVLAALAATPTLVRRPLRARDTNLMAGALRALGVGVEDRGLDWQVAPPVGRWRGDATIDCGLAGTVMRFVPPLAALADGPVRFDGDAPARQRPLRPVLQALRDLGVAVEGDALPMTVHGTGGVGGGSVHVDASGSSQFVSALLMAGCAYDGGLRVTHIGATLPSIPHIAMTLAALRAAGVPAEQVGPASWRVRRARPHLGVAELEPDLSNAAPFLAAAALTGGAVTVPGWPAATTQPGDLLRDVLARMGADVSWSAEGGCTVRGGGRLRGVDLDLSPAGELAPVLVTLAALADGPSVFRGIAHLRGHETDRLAALARELTALGADVTETADGLRVRPRPLHGGVVRSYADHRLAQAGALLGLAVAGISVEDIATTAKTLPDFPGMWTAMLGTAG